MMVSKFGIAAVFAAGLGFAGSAEATPIATTFNFVTIGNPTSNTGDVTTATFITDPGPNLTSFIVTDNTGLVSGTTLISVTSPTPVTLGANFIKEFTTALGTFQESLTVDNVTIGTTSRGVSAHGTITEIVTLSGPTLTSTSVFYSAAYTQNGGPGAQINVSYNDSTTPPPPPPPPPPSPTPEPASLALLGAGLAGLGALRRRRKV